MKITGATAQILDWDSFIVVVKEVGARPPIVAGFYWVKWLGEGDRWEPAEFDGTSWRMMYQYDCDDTPETVGPRLTPPNGLYQELS